MTNYHYILNENGDPVPCEFMECAKWLEDAGDKRIVKITDVGEVRVSTVFLALNHNYGPGEPLIYETMIFGGPHDEYQERYSTKAQALEGHERAVELAKQPTTEGRDE